MKKEAGITILVVPYDGPTRVETIPNTLEGLQAPVEGRIEVFPVGIAGAVGLCNDEGLNEGLPFSRYVPELGHPICGTFLVVRDAGPEFGSLSEAQIKTARELFDA